MSRISGSHLAIVSHNHVGNTLALTMLGEFHISWLVPNSPLPG